MVLSPFLFLFFHLLFKVLTVLFRLYVYNHIICSEKREKRGERGNHGPFSFFSFFFEKTADHLEKNSSIEKVDFLLLEKIEMVSGILFYFSEKGHPIESHCWQFLLLFKLFVQLFYFYNTVLFFKKKWTMVLSLHSFSFHTCCCQVMVDMFSRATRSVALKTAFQVYFLNSRSTMVFSKGEGPWFPLSFLFFSVSCLRFKLSSSDYVIAIT
jgi:hypothetical protein